MRTNPHKLGVPSPDCTRCGSAGSVEFSMCQVCLSEVRAVVVAARVAERHVRLDEPLVETVGAVGA